MLYDTYAKPVDVEFYQFSCHIISVQPEAVDPFFIEAVSYVLEHVLPQRIIAF